MHCKTMRYHSGIQYPCSNRAMKCKEVHLRKLVWPLPKTLKLIPAFYNELNNEAQCNRVTRNFHQYYNHRA